MSVSDYPALQTPALTRPAVPSTPASQPRTPPPPPKPPHRPVADEPTANPSEVERTAPTLQVEPWPDPVIEALGHDPRSLYVETFWLPTLGPSTTWLLRRLVRKLEEHPAGFLFDCATASMDLGLGGHTGKHSVLMRSIDRSCRFGMAQRNGDALFVRRRLPPLTNRQVNRLSPDLVQAHAEWERSPTDAERQTAASPDALIARARQLALTLFDLGEESEAVERQLHAWNFHPAIAWNAMEWAQAEAITSE